MRTIVRIIALSATMFAAGPSLAQQYPSRPVRIRAEVAKWKKVIGDAKINKI